MMKALSKYYVWFGLLAVCLFFCWRAAGFNVHDFTNYYFGGKLLASGNFSSDIYFPYWFNRQILELGHSGLFASYAPNTPFVALVFYPLSMFSLATAKLVFNTLSITLFIVSLYRLQRFYKIRMVFVLLLPVLFFIPIKNELLFGQVYFLLFFLLAEGLLAYEKKQWLKMAIFLGLAIFLKIFPILFVLLFLFRRQFRPLFYTAGICLLLLGFSVIFTGFEVWVFYLQNVLPKASDGAIATAYVTNYQSFFMFCREFLVFEASENPDAVFAAPLLFTSIIMAFKIGVLSIGYFLSKKSSDTLFVFSYWVFASLLISPYGSTYSCILLLFVYFYLAKCETALPKKIISIGLLFLVNNLPLAYFLENPFPFSYLRLFFLLWLFILIVLHFREAVRWKWVAGMVVIPALSMFFFNGNQSGNPSYFLDKTAPILVYDYTINKNELVYFYWDEKGTNQKAMPFEFETIASLTIRNNQVFYDDRQLTSSKGNKQKPILINRKMLIYLSDEDRGIGFYTLRKITIN